MKITRNQKIQIVQLLYQADVLNNKVVDSTNVDHDLVDYTYSIINKVSAIDEVISKYLQNYSIDRLSYLDRAIIRLATYELLYTSLSIGNIINDAIEITKTYSDLDDEKQHKFTNRLLQNISNGVRK